MSDRKPCPACGGTMKHVAGRIAPHHPQHVWPDRYLVSCGFICTTATCDHVEDCPESADLPPVIHS